MHHSILQDASVHMGVFRGHYERWALSQVLLLQLTIFH